MAKVILYYSSATSDLAIKKNQQSLKFLLEKKKVEFTETDMASSTKEARDAVYAKANSRKLPLLFVGDKFVGVFPISKCNEEGIRKNFRIGGRRTI